MWLLAKPLKALTHYRFGYSHFTKNELNLRPTQILGGRVIVSIIRCLYYMKRKPLECHIMAKFVSQKITTFQLINSCRSESWLAVRTLGDIISGVKRPKNGTVVTVFYSRLPKIQWGE